MREELEEASIARHAKLDQCLELQVFNHNYEQAKMWMVACEQSLHVDQESGSVDQLIKKHEDFDRAINSQEEKMGTLQNLTEHLINNNHYDSPGIGQRRDQVMDRWWNLKESLLENCSKLGEAQTMQQFSCDVDELEIWISEKLQMAMEESYKDPSNIQSKHQKHQAFEAELPANADRLGSVCGMGQKLIDNQQCAGSEKAVDE